MSPGPENDYLAWRRTFWKSVENGLKRDETLSAMKHKSCTCSADGNCCCKTDGERYGLSEVLYCTVLYCTMVWYGMVYVNLYSAIVTNVSNTIQGGGASARLIAPPAPGLRLHERVQCTAVEGQESVAFCVCAIRLAILARSSWTMCSAYVRSVFGWCVV